MLDYRRFVTCLLLFICLGFVASCSLNPEVDEGKVAVHFPENASYLLRSMETDVAASGGLKCVIRVSGDAQSTYEFDYKSLAEMNDLWIEISGFVFSNNLVFEIELQSNGKILYSGKSDSVLITKDQKILDFELRPNTQQPDISMTVSDFVTALAGVETITANIGERGIKISEDGKTANVYGVSISGAFALGTSMPATLISADLSGVDTSGVTSMSRMFLNCNKLENLNLSTLNTSNVTDMERMFALCDVLDNVDFSNFDTSNVTNMKTMFYYAKGFTSLDLSSFNTENVTTMEQMFIHCDSLQAVDLSGADTKNVTTFAKMFSSCSNLQTIYASDKFVCSEGSTTTNMFSSNTSLVGARPFDSSKNDGTYANLLGYFTSKTPLHPGYKFMTVTQLLALLDGVEHITANVSEAGVTVNEETKTANAYNVMLLDNFNYSNHMPSSLISADLTGIDTRYVTSMSCLFYRCTALESVNLSGLNTSNVTSMGSMFSDCEALQQIDISSFDTSKVTVMSGMFQQCYVLDTINLSGIDTSQVTDMSSMFSSCRVLTSLDLSGFNTAKVTTMENMFWSCIALTSINVSNFDTREVTVMDTMFQNCYALQILDLSSFSTPKLTGISGMFTTCKELTTIYVSTGFTTENVTTTNGVFASCTKLVGAVPFNSSSVRKDMANYTTGYFTLKQ